MDDRTQFKQAVHCIMHATSEADRKSADKWLENWQTQPVAWQVADSVLHDPASSEEEQYFAAHTFRTKVQRDFEELPTESAHSLRDSLVSQLVVHASKSKMVRVQLCLAIASIAIHLPSSSFGSEGLIVWLYQRLSREPPEVAMICMLELLAVLPQEADCVRAAVRPERRRQAVAEMRAMLPQGLQALEACLQHPSKGVKERVLQAFAQWMHLSGAEGLGSAALAQNTLVQLAFAGLHDEQTFDAAVEAVSELVWCTVRTDSDGMPTIKTDLQAFVPVLVSEVMKLRPRFREALTHAMRAQEGAADLPELSGEENVRGMVRLFMDVAEAYDQLLSTGQPELMLPIEAALEVAMHPDDAISTSSLGFFSKLSSRIHHRYYPDPSCRVRLQQYFHQLVQLVQGRVKYPVGYESWRTDERREFKRQRYNIQETLTDAASVIGGKEMLQLLMRPLAETPPDAENWRAAEAALFCIKGMYTEAPAPRDRMLVGLLQSLPQLPPHPLLQYSACGVIQRYACWLATSALEDPSLNSLVGPLLKLAMRGMSAHDTSGGAALAFASLCFNCAPFVRDQLPDMIAVLKQALMVETWKGAGTMRGKGGLELEEEDVFSIVEGIAIVLSAAATGHDQQIPSAATEVLEMICMPVSMAFSKAKEKGLAVLTPDETELYPVAKHSIPRIAMFFDKFSCQPLALDLFVRLWPQIVMYLRCSGSDNSLVEECLKVVTKAIRTIGTTDQAKWLPMLLEFTPQAYVETSHPAYLYVISTIIKEFGRDPAQQAPLHAALVPMVQHACARLKTLKDFREQPDLADDLFLLAYRGIASSPGLIISQSIVQLLLDTAMCGMLAQHPHAHGSIQQFIKRLADPKTLSTHPNPPAAAQLLQPLFASRMPMVLRLYVAGVVGVTPVNRFPDMSEALQRVLQATAQAGMQWLHAALSLIPDQCATNHDKENFLSIVAQALQANPDSVDEMSQGAWRIEHAMKELADVCRRSSRVRTEAEAAVVPPEIYAILYVT